MKNSLPSLSSISFAKCFVRKVGTQRDEGCIKKEEKKKRVSAEEDNQPINYEDGKY